MSAQSLAAFRKSAGDDLANLAEQHLQHDLTDTDRAALTSAASTISTHALIGSAAGLALGGFLAFRLRSARKAVFSAFRATERPIAVKFANGREEAIPDLTPLMKPSTLGDIATYTLFAVGGVFVGGEMGVFTGMWRAKSGIERDGASRQRIETAFRSFRADVLRKQIAELEAGKGEPMLS